jgi:hypothetical protein
MPLILAHNCLFHLHMQVVSTSGPRQSPPCCIANVLVDWMGPNLVVDSEGTFDFSRGRVCDGMVLHF